MAQACAAAFIITIPDEALAFEKQSKLSEERQQAQPSSASVVPTCMWLDAAHSQAQCIARACAQHQNTAQLLVL